MKMPLAMPSMPPNALGPDAFANILQAIGVPEPHFIAWSTVLVEILGGLAVTLGAFVMLASGEIEDTDLQRRASGVKILLECDSRLNESSVSTRFCGSILHFILVIDVHICYTGTVGSG
jgi:hypothetical protein